MVNGNKIYFKDDIFFNLTWNIWWINKNFNTITPMRDRRDQQQKNVSTY